MTRSRTPRMVSPIASYRVSVSVWLIPPSGFRSNTGKDDPLGTAVAGMLAVTRELQLAAVIVG